MTIDELKSELRAILVEEENPNVDWTRVEDLCLNTIRRLNTETNPAYPHDVVYLFLDDPDVRLKSPEYAETQRQRVKRWLAGD